jgi:drug/metabolite transporter (DMT)-like permease
MWYVYAMGAAALWGLEYAIMGRLFNGRISPLVLLTMQMATGALVLGAISLTSGRFAIEMKQVADDRSFLWLVLFSLIVFTSANFLIAQSIQESNALLAGLAEISYPLFILVFTIMLGWAEPVTARALFGGMLILVGAIFLKTS